MFFKLLLMCLKIFKNVLLPFFTSNKPSSHPFLSQFYLSIFLKAKNYMHLALSTKPVFIIHIYVSINIYINIYDNVCFVYTV